MLDNTQTGNPNILAIIMDLREGVARLQERLTAQGEATSMALESLRKASQETAQAVRDLTKTVDEWQDRTSTAESKIADLEKRLGQLRTELESHVSAEAEKVEVLQKEERENKTWFQRQKITAFQAVFMLVATVGLGTLFNVIGALALRLLGLK